MTDGLAKIRELAGEVHDLSRAIVNRDASNVYGMTEAEWRAHSVETEVLRAKLYAADRKLRQAQEAFAKESSHD